MEHAEQSLAERLGVDDDPGIPARAPFFAVVFGALTDARFTDSIDDRPGPWHLFVWIAIYDYQSFGALNKTAGVASGRLFQWLDALKADGLIAHHGPGEITEWDYTERGRLAAYLVRATLEDFVSRSGSVG